MPKLTLNNKKQQIKKKQTNAKKNKTLNIKTINKTYTPSEDEPDAKKPLKNIKKLYSHSQRGIRNTNSMNRYGKLLKLVERKILEDEEDAGKGEINIVDCSIVAVYSREAFENFGNKWRTEVYNKQLMGKFKENEAAQERAKKQNISTQKSFPDQVNALLANKNIPHVIAVIEGKSGVPSLNTTQGKEPLHYKQIHFEAGLSSSGGDHKQSMTFYVRVDLEKAYSFKAVEIPHKKDNKEEKIKCMSINYETNSNKYSSLVVHIPNQYVGGTKDKEVHKSFKNYAKNINKAKKVDDKEVMVTSYFGDTNFSKSILQNSSPSVGGILSNGETASAPSSGAKKETYFMQTIPLRNGKNARTLQPSVLNYVLIDNTGTENREATDHPSMMNYTVHNEEILGREPEKLKHYYQSLAS